MEKQKIYYKVVRASYIKDIFISARAPRDILLEYQIGLKTWPHFGKIFAFKDRKSAYDFKRNDEFVFKCTGTKSKYLRMISAVIFDFEIFWKDPNELKKSAFMSTPKGTVFLNDCTLIKEVK